VASDNGVPGFVVGEGERIKGHIGRVSPELFKKL
jgi:hypothetical protein